MDSEAMAEILFKNQARHEMNVANDRNNEVLQALPKTKPGGSMVGQTPYSTLPMHDKSIDQSKSQTSVNKSPGKGDESASHVVVMSHHNTHPSPLRDNE